MTFYAFDDIVGPGKYGKFPTGFLYYNLDDNNDAEAKVFALPSGGTITDVGLYVGAKVGTPPEYKVGLTEVNPYTGFPMQSPYGGSAIYSWTPTNTSAQWIWFTLSTPAVGVMGDIVAIHVYPSGTTPNTSNYTRIERSNIWSDSSYGFTLPFREQFSTTWIATNGYGIWAVKFDDGNVFGIPAIALHYVQTVSTSSPDEIGNKFSLSFDTISNGFSAAFNSLDSGVDLTFTLYDNNDTIIAEKRFNNLTYWNDSYSYTEWMSLYWDSPVTLTKDINYRITVKANTSSAGFYLSGMQFESSTSRTNNMWDMFNKWQRTERTDGGSWTDSDDKIACVSIIISGIEITEVPASGAGGSYAYIG